MLQALKETALERQRAKRNACETSSPSQQQRRLSNVRDPFTVRAFAEAHGPAVNSLLSSDSPLNLAPLFLVTSASTTKQLAAPPATPASPSSQDTTETSAIKKPALSLMEQMMLGTLDQEDVRKRESNSQSVACAVKSEATGTNRSNEGTSVPASRPHPTGTLKRDPRCHSSSSSSDSDGSSSDDELAGQKKAKTKNKKRLGDGEQTIKELEICTPYYDEEERRIVVCDTYPAEEQLRSDRAFDELMTAAHFALLARDNKTDRQPETHQQERPTELVLSEGAGSVPTPSSTELRTAVQRVLAHHLTVSLKTERLRHKAEADRKAGAKREAESRFTVTRASASSTSGGNQRGTSSEEPELTLQAVTARWNPWGAPALGNDAVSVVGEARNSVAAMVRSPWCEASEAQLDDAALRIHLVLNSALSVPSFALLTQRWIPQQMASDSVASAMFPHDEPTQRAIAAHCECLRWRLIQAAAEAGAAGVRAECRKTAVDGFQYRTQKVLRWSGTVLVPARSSDSSLAAATSADDFPPSLVSYFPTPERFLLALSLIRRFEQEQSVAGLAAPSDDELRALMFFDAVLFDIERSTKGAAVRW